jgi:hypothetical protein
MPHAEHHFVPAFLLRHWETGADMKLTSFRWSRGNVAASRFKAKGVAKARHLYSMQRSHPEPDVQVEKEFFGRHVDDPAAVVHAKMLASGVSGLSPEEKQVWSPFLISLILRGPTMIQHIRRRGREVLEVGLDRSPEEYIAVRGDEPAPTLRDWVETNQPDTLDDLGVMVLPELTFSEKLNLTVLNVTWGIRSVHPARYNLLIGDRPLILAGRFETNFLLALPISPTKLFFAFNDERTFANVRSYDHDAFVKAMNTSTVKAAESYVYSTDAAQQSFVRKFLRHSVN